MDRKPPSITVTAPGANATYQLNATIGANYACTDGGSGVASCQGPVANGGAIDTSSTGTKSFTVASTDNVGNPSTSTVTYNVVTGPPTGTASADVSITMSAPTRVAPNATFTYAMTISNLSKTTATGVVVSDALPTGTTIVSASTSQGTITAPPTGSNGTVTVNLGSLVKGTSARVNIVVKVTASINTTLTNTANVTATTQDPNAANNSATRKTTVK